MYKKCNQKGNKINYITTVIDHAMKSSTARKIIYTKKYFKKIKI